MCRVSQLTESNLVIIIAWDKLSWGNMGMITENGLTI